MEFIQKINHVSILPRKLRQAVRQIKNRPIKILKEELQLIEKSIGQVLVKGIEAAEDRIQQAALDPAEFNVKRIICNEGQKLPRRRFASRGRFNRFIRQRSNINIIVADKSKITGQSQTSDQADSKENI